MNRNDLLHRSAVASVAAAAALLAAMPAWAQAPAAATAPAAASAAIAGRAERPVPSAPADAAQPATCIVPLGHARFDHPLRRTAQRLAAGLPIRMVALGSSSTAGDGASSPVASYPSRLAVELSRHFPGHQFTMLNRGISGAVAADMLARFETSVIADKPDLVLWQVGTNSVLRDHPLQRHFSVLQAGVARSKAIGTDLVLIDPQFAPKVIAKPDIEGMVALIASIAKVENINLFHRFALMRHWREVEKLPFNVFLSPDELHMNDWSYACLARALGAAIAEAAIRPSVTEVAGQPVR